MAMALLVGAGAASGADLEVKVAGVRNDRGHVLVAVCTAETFLGTGCPYGARAAASVGDVSMQLRGIPPGTYAVQAFHDEDDDGEIDRNVFGLPREGMGFSNDAPMRFGPPRFEEAAVSIDDGHHAIRFRMHYFGDG